MTALAPVKVAIAAPAVSQKPAAAGGGALSGASGGIETPRGIEPANGAAAAVAAIVAREGPAKEGGGVNPPTFTAAIFADSSVMRAMTEAKAAPVSSLAPIISLDSKTAILAVLPRQDLGGEAVKHEQFGHRFFGCGVDRQRPQLEDEIAGRYSVGVAAAGRKKSKSAALIALASVNERRARSDPPSLDRPSPWSSTRSR